MLLGRASGEATLHCIFLEMVVSSVQCEEPLSPVALELRSGAQKLHRQNGHLALGGKVIGRRIIKYILFTPRCPIHCVGEAGCS